MRALTKSLNRYTYSNPAGDDVSTFIRCASSAHNGSRQALVLEKSLASGPLQGRELRDSTLVVSRYAGIAVFHRLMMALTYDPCKPLKTRRGGRGSTLTLRETVPFSLPSLSKYEPTGRVCPCLALDTQTCQLKAHRKESTYPHKTLEKIGHREAGR